METLWKTVVLLASLFSVAFCGFRLIGGYTEGTTQDVVRFEEIVRTEYQSTYGSNELVNVQFSDVTKQIVNGMNFKFTAKICSTNGQCMLSCRVHIYEPIGGPGELQSMTCQQNHVDKRSVDANNLLGGEAAVAPHDAAVLAAANFAVNEINHRSNSLYRDMLLDVTHVVRQTVSGYKYKIQVEVGVSSCRNTPLTDDASLDDCPVSSNQRRLCTVVVHHQSWLTPPYSLLSFTCHTADDSANENSVVKQNDKPLIGGDDHDIGHHGDFLLFMKAYNKTYSSDEEHVRRFNIFRENMLKAQNLQKHDQGDATYGASPFADLSAEEFRRNYLTPQWDLTFDPYLKPAQIPAGGAPDAFDWRDHNAVTAVKNQGSCGSCWAFSTTGNIEGQWAIHKSQLLSLSEQELVDCDKLDDGCDGGLPTNAYKEIERLGGLETETDYPYEAEDEKCSFQKKEAKVQISGAVNISSNEDDMAAWLAQNGPISIGINAMAMQFYMGGVSHPWSIFCNPDELDHGVLIVGYGVKSGFFGKTPYWIIKNSWGSSWGEQGYYRVYRGGGVCGLNKMPTSSVVN